MKHLLPYPVRATRISIDLNPFGFWLVPDWHLRKTLSDVAKVEGATIWWFRWLWFQVSYSRWR